MQNTNIESLDMCFHSSRSDRPEAVEDLAASSGSLLDIGLHSLAGVLYPIKVTRKVA